MPSVTVPADFFRGELRVYGNWREAFARELLQNSCDANPCQITIKTYTENGHGQVVFTDDGVGMSRSVLEDVFFALGRTTKTGEGVVGGFGRARIITCFAQTSYEIRTHNLLVTGQGGQYTITETPDFFAGCRFAITLLDEDHEAIARAFRVLLRGCALPVPVVLDDAPARRAMLPSRARRILRDSTGREWAKVYATSGHGNVFVRVRGLLTFTRWSDCDQDLVVELSAARSRDVLAASRDTLHTEFGTQLDQLIAALSQNRKRALSAVTEPLNVHVGGGGFLVTDAGTTPEGPPAGEADAEAATDAPSGEHTEDAFEGTGVRLNAGNMAAFMNLHPGQAVVGRTLEAPEPDVNLGFDVFMLADTNDARVRKLTRAWNPTGWDTTTGKRRRQLLLTWKVACAVAVDALVRHQPSLGRVAWTVGWTFDDDARACHTAVGDGHVLALNPVTATGKTRYQVSSRAHRRDLLASALHEAAHIVYENHNEDFAALLTSLYASVDQVAADRDMRTQSVRI